MPLGDCLKRSDDDSDDASQAAIATAAIEFIYGPLAENPRRVGKPLRFDLAGLYSARRGDYRILYRIDDVVTITGIEHRADVYR